MAPPQKIPTSCVSIDGILRGGLSSESVSLIYGEPEAGKTTLAMQCAVNCAKLGYKTLFVDCDGSFSARRLAQIASERFEEVAELIILMKPSDFREQAAVIDKLEDYLTKSFGLVIIDTLTSLYRLRIAESPNRTFEFNRELNRQAAILAQIARIEKIAVLLTSQVRSVFNETGVRVEPVGTRVLKFWADAIINLEPTETTGIVEAVLEKSPKGIQPYKVNLKIDGTGIRDCLDP